VVRYEVKQVAHRLDVAHREGKDREEDHSREGHTCEILLVNSLSVYSFSTLDPRGCGDVYGYPEDRTWARKSQLHRRSCLVQREQTSAPKVEGMSRSVVAFI
jgi:hypothetical protein